MTKTEIKIAVTFTESVLGSLPGNPQLMEDYIVTKMAKDKGKTPDIVKKNSAEKIAAVSDPDTADERIEKATTVFARDEKGLFCWDYTWRGFLKESISVLIELGEASVKKLSKWSCKRSVDSLVFVAPRRIYFRDDKDRPIMQPESICERPLRASTMQGDRIALARSELLPAGTNCQFTITLLEGTNAKSNLAVLTKDSIIEALEYGAMKGYGQWRGGSFGRFSYKEL